MKTFLSILLAISILIPSYGFGEPDKDTTPSTQKATEALPEVNEKYLVEQKVKALPSSHAKTVDLYISMMAAIPGASDLGWQVHKVDGGYEVIREIQKGPQVYSFKWAVSDSGEVTPLNKRAQDITKQPEPGPEKSAN